MPSKHSRLSRVAVVAAVSGLTVSACGDDTIDDTSATDASTDTTAPTDLLPSSTDPTPTDPAPGALPKPEVSIPATLPTELVISDLTEGTGDAAAAGDTVIVHYVGVRSVDGTEFDNSYDSGSPLPVTLGTGGVIAGWEQGLIGVRQGGRRQLDIPTELAYGDSPSGDIIQPGDALSFVIDVVAVIGAGDPADAPDVSIVGATNQAEIAIEDLVEGTGPILEPGQTAAVQIVAYRADTGEKITSTWDEGAVPFTFVVGNNEVLVGIDLGVEGMAVGGRRQVAVPFLLAFGDAGNPDFGLPEQTDMVLIIDLVAAY
jgi:peptidylprolyl isomerase